MLPLTPASLPDQIGRFRVDGVAGVGGMGLVLRATDTVLERPVALKVLTGSYDAIARERLIREAKHLASLSHPHVVEVYDAGEEDGLVYVAMRWVEGPNLETEVKDSGALAPVRAAAVISEVAAALDAAHGRGLIHRDVKPANVLLCAEDGHALLADFGITTATEMTQGLTASGEVVATADFAAPEQIEGRGVDARTDVYALGGVAFFVLTGSLPYPRDGAVAKLWAHVNEPPPSACALRPDLSTTVDDALARAMAKSPDARFESAGAFAAALSDAVRVESTMELPAVPAPRRSRRARVAVLALIAVLAAGIGGAAFALAPSGSDAPPAPPQAEAEAKPKKPPAKKKKQQPKRERATATAAAPAPAPVSEAPAPVEQPAKKAEKPKADESEEPITAPEAEEAPVEEPEEIEPAPAEEEPLPDQAPPAEAAPPEGAGPPGGW